MDPADYTEWDNNTTGVEPVSADGATEVEDPELEPTIRLTRGLDLNNLSEGEGTTFEVELPDAGYDEAAEAKKYFDPEEIFKDEGTSVPDWNVEDDSVGGEDETRTAFQIMASKMEKLTDDGGVCKKILKRGIGNVVPPYAFVQAHYDGYLEYADEPFDSSRFQNCIRRHKLGQGELITGLEIGLSTMRKGELAQFLLQPEYAFGKLGSPPRIPAEATILFQVELLEFTDKAGADEFFSLTREERKSADFKLILKVVEAEKKEGNEFFKCRYFPRALGKYKKAIDVLEEYHAQGDEDDTKRQNLLYKLYLNAGLTALKTTRPGLALHYCRSALYIQERSAKAFYIRGKAFMMQHHFKQAKDALDKARRFHPDSEDVLKALEDLEKEVKKESLMEKEACQRMFGFEGETPSKEKKNVDENADPNQGREYEEDLPGDIGGCSPEFRDMMQQTLQEFVENADVAELPMPCQDFSSSELSFIAGVAEELQLICKKVGEGNNVRLMIRKQR